MKKKLISRKKVKKKTLLMISRFYFKDFKVEFLKFKFNFSKDFKYFVRFFNLLSNFNVRY